MAGGAPRRAAPRVTPIWAVVPIKEISDAKQRLSGRLSASARRELALTMAEDVLAALSGVEQLAGLIVVTVDPAVAGMAQRYGARISELGARDGHTGAVTANGRDLAARGCGLLTMPGDIPLVSAAEVRTVLAAHREPPSFTIVPARDFLGSNAIVMSPADAVPLRFGDDSFYPHLAAAERSGIVPRIVRCPGIELDIDSPEDFAALEATTGTTRTHRLLARWREEADAIGRDGPTRPA